MPPDLPPLPLSLPPVAAQHGARGVGSGNAVTSGEDPRDGPGGAATSPAASGAVGGLRSEDGRGSPPALASDLDPLGVDGGLGARAPLGEPSREVFRLNLDDQINVTYNARRITAKRSVKPVRPPPQNQPPRPRPPRWSFSRAFSLGHDMWVTAGLVWCEACAGYSTIHGAPRILNAVCLRPRVSDLSKQKQFIRRNLLEGKHPDSRKPLGVVRKLFPLPFPRAPWETQPRGSIETMLRLDVQCTGSGWFLGLLGGLGRLGLLVEDPPATLPTER